jgi:hypothetical protein
MLLSTLDEVKEFERRIISTWGRILVIPSVVNIYQWSPFIGSFLHNRSTSAPCKFNVQKSKIITEFENIASDDSNV